MLSRRHFFEIIPITSIAVTSLLNPDKIKSESNVINVLIASPPVILNPRKNGFGVSIAVNRLATAWVEYGFDKDVLNFKSQATFRGLIQADDQAIQIRVVHPEDLPVKSPVYYRVVVQPLNYKSSYELQI